MEQTLETVLKSISNPGVLASAGGMVLDPSLRQQQLPVDPGSAGAEARADVHIGTPGGNGMPGDHQRGHLVSGVHFDAAGRSTMEWSGVRNERDGGRDDSPRLHSLPDNTLNP